MALPYVFFKLKKSYCPNVPYLPPLFLKIQTFVVGVAVQTSVCLWEEESGKIAITQNMEGWCAQRVKLLQLTRYLHVETVQNPLGPTSTLCTIHLVIHRGYSIGWIRNASSCLVTIKGLFIPEISWVDQNIITTCPTAVTEHLESVVIPLPIWLYANFFFTSSGSFERESITYDQKWKVEFSLNIHDWGLKDHLRYEIKLQANAFIDRERH